MNGNISTLIHKYTAVSLLKKDNEEDCNSFYKRD